MRRRPGSWIPQAAVVALIGVTAGLAGLNAGGDAASPLPSVAPARPPAAPSPALPPTPPPSPILYFRQLLAATPADQERQLAEQSPRQRESIEAKLREYQALDPAEREARLFATELRWYLLPLLTLPQTNRAARLAVIPDALRPELEARLRVWDALDSVTRQDVLDFQGALLRTARELTPAPPTAPPGSILPPARQQQADRQLARWQTLPADRRQRMLAAFDRFFALTPRQQQRALNTLSDDERREMEKTLRAFANLAPAQRRQCLEAFDKFARLTPDQRAEFARNAEVWQRLTPEQRSEWRRIVARMPPLPPGAGGPPRPPLPPPRSASEGVPALATNR